MNIKNLKIYTNKNRKYKLKRIISGMLIAPTLITLLNGCSIKEIPDHQDSEINTSYSEYYDYVVDTVSPSYEELETKENDNANDNFSLEINLDKQSLEIINSEVYLDTTLLNNFFYYVNGINATYKYSDLYNPEFILNKYNSLGTYKSNVTNIFINNLISGEDLYKIVKQNNINYGIIEKATMNDSDLKEICYIISDVLNDYIKKNSNIDLNLLSEKIYDLKILKFDDFSNGYFDSVSGQMGFNISYLKSKSNDFFKKTVEHETYHFIQGNSLKEKNELNFESRTGFTYKFNDVNVNALHWNWYFEGAAEYLTCNFNNCKTSEVYASLIKSMDTIKTATLLSNENNVSSFENISLSNDLNDLFEYFNCKTIYDKIEVINLMYSYNIIYNLNFSSDDFYSQYKNNYGESVSKRNVENELKNSIAQSLTKYFYRDLSNILVNKEIRIEEIFKLISIFENELSREIWYNSNQATLLEFFEMYNKVQTELFSIIANKLNVSIEQVQKAYNSYNNQVDINLNNVKLINQEKKDFYNYILETRQNDKMNSINYVSGIYSNNDKYR